MGCSAPIPTAPSRAYRQGQGDRPEQIPRLDNPNWRVRDREPTTSLLRQLLLFGLATPASTRATGPRIVWAELDRLFEFFLGSSPVPVVEEFDCP